VKSWERDLETHLTVLGRFVDLVGLPASEAELLKRELERYVRVRIARELWMHPDITRFHTEWYREFYRILDVDDPYRTLKDRSMRAAHELLASLELPTLRDAVLACVVANLLDYGAPNLRESLSADDFAHLDRLPLFVDDFERLADALGRARRVVWLADNSGEVLFDLVVLQRLRRLNPACTVDLVGKGGPMLNDVTADELAALDLPANCRVLSTGSNSFGVPEDEVSDDLKAALRDADVVVAKGHSYLEFWAHYAMPTLFHLAFTKFPVRDALWPEIPEGVALVLWAGRYAEGKPPYDAAARAVSA
jgi:uncharacterized protein with ATP-grasp and redox domains